MWLWANTAASLPVNHALADFLHHNSDTNSLINQNNNARFESKRYLPRYKTFASYPVFDIRSRSTLKQAQDGVPLPATTPLTLLSFPFPAYANSAKLLPKVEATSYSVDSTDTTTQNFPTSTHSTTPQFGEILSMRVSTSVTNSQRPHEEGKPQVRESTTELNTESTMKPDNTVLDTQTTPRYSMDKSSPGTLGIIAYYNVDTNSDTTQLETTTFAELVNSNDLTKSRTMDYYAYQEVGHARIGKSSSSHQNKQDEQAEESKAVTTRVPIDYLPSPEASYGKPEENYEISEADNVHSNGRIHGVQTTSTTTTEKTIDEAKAEADRRKSNYVVEGRNYKKYRVEEETSDGFIVGEYGVFSHNDGSMRGVRYTAESNINPRLIYHALLKFLSLQ